MALNTRRTVRVASLAELKQLGRMALQVEGHRIALFLDGDKVHAVDNRCPHMGFPLDRGSVRDGILICHWHHARFDLASGGTFDQFADDVRAFPTEVRDGEVWVDLTPRANPLDHQRQRLRDGLERDISLVIAKAVIALLDGGLSPAEPFRAGLEFGVRYRQAGWGQGLTILTCMMNLLPQLEAQDRPRALYHGLTAVARDCDGQPPRFPLRPLPGSTPDLPTLKAWFRQFVEVRDSEGAERCVVSAIRAGAGPREMAGLLFSAATDHRYLDTGHRLDFTNKALEALDHAGWDLAEPVLSSLVAGYADATRMEEASSWRNPVDLVSILDDAFQALPGIVSHSRSLRGGWTGRDALVPILLGDDPAAAVDALLVALGEGATEEDLAGVVAYAAALRIARFHTSNEFGDWDTALHSFTFANAVHQGLRRAPSVELLRGVFDGAMTVYLDRFLNVPPARLPEPGDARGDPQGLLASLPGLLDRQQQVDAAGELVGGFLYSGGDPKGLLPLLGRMLLREDRDFHTIQTLEASIRQYSILGDGAGRTPLLVAAARYLAAHSPTVRSQGQTYQIASRLFRGEHLFEE